MKRREENETKCNGVESKERKGNIVKQSKAKRNETNGIVKYAEGHEDNLQVGAALEVLDPLVGLVLRVDHQRPATGIGDHDAVVDGERVVGQAGNEPLAHLDRLAEDAAE
eukprot:scaffold311304_cov31-Prasinocladus_malaysianus.AAC.1